MRITVDDFLRDESVIEYLASPMETCHCCGVSIQETITGRYKIGDEVFCAEDYFGKLGEELEAHPVHSAGVRCA
jgi:hypothetical protein